MRVLIAAVLASAALALVPAPRRALGPSAARYRLHASMLETPRPVPFGNGTSPLTPSSAKVSLRPSSRPARPAPAAPPLAPSDVLLIFLVDSSSSASARRIAAVRGAALSILAQPYHKRTRVSIIPFKGMQAHVQLPPTSSIALASRRLDRLAPGSGSPLAHGLQLAARTAREAISSGTARRAVVLCLSDGRANIPLSASATGSIAEHTGGHGYDSWETAARVREQMRGEVLGVASELNHLRTLGVSTVMVDTESRFASVQSALAQQVAQACGGSYEHVPAATDSQLVGVAARATRAALLGAAAPRGGEEPLAHVPLRNIVAGMHCEEDGENHNGPQ